jgi:hypothetical protein
MWWGIGGGLYFLFWLTLLVFLGVTTLRKGHWVLFLFGIIFPLLWIVGAVIPPKQSAQMA